MSKQQKERTKMKKIAVLSLALICLLSVLAGCGGKKEMDPQKLTEELLPALGENLEDLRESGFFRRMR